MSKRGAGAQGGPRGEGAGLPASDDDAPRRATAAQIAGRKIAQAKTRRHLGPSSNNNRSPSSLQSIGDPFVTIDQNTVNGSTPSKPQGFGQQQAPFSFSSLQSQSFPPTNNENNPNSMFGGGSLFNAQNTQNSFPPPNNGSGGLFGGSINTSSTGFNFSAGGSNPFSKTNNPSQSTFSGSIFNLGGSNSSTPAFGQTPSNGSLSEQQKDQPDEAAIDDSMQISPPTTPARGTGVSANQPSIMGTISDDKRNNGEQTSASNPFTALATPKSSSFTSTFGTSAPSNNNPAKNFAPAPTSTTSQSTSSLFVPTINSQPSSQSFSKPASPAPPAPQSLNLFQPSAPNSTQPAASSTPAQANTFKFPSASGSSSSDAPSADPKPVASAKSQTTPQQPLPNFFSSLKKPEATAPKLIDEPTLTPSSTSAIAVSSSTMKHPPESAMKFVPSEPELADRIPGYHDMSYKQKVYCESGIFIKALNVSLKSALDIADSTLDWSPIMRLYLQRRDYYLEDNPAMGFPTPRKRKYTDASDFANKQPRTAENDSETDKNDQRPASQTSNIFQSIVNNKDTGSSGQTPHSKPSLFSSSPANLKAATTNVSSPSTEAAGQPKLFTPKVPSSLSNVQNAASSPASSSVFSGYSKATASESTPAQPASGLFQPNFTGSAAKTSNLFQPTKNTPSANSGGTHNTESGGILNAGTNSRPLSGNSGLFASAATPTASSNIFGHSAKSSGSQSTGEESDSKSESKTSTGGFKMPAFGDSTAKTDFISQFGKKAQETDKKAKAKRKAEDFDSDEETEEEWERRDAEEQRSKKAKLQNLSSNKAVFVPGKGFEFHTDESAASSVNGDAESVDDSANEANSQPVYSSSASAGDSGDNVSSNVGKSLFDRITPADNSANTQPASESGTPANAFSSTLQANGSTSLFGASASVPAKKDNADHTWKADEPIKFSPGNKMPAFKFSAPTPSKDGLPTTQSSSTLGTSNNLFGGFAPKTADPSKSLFSTTPTNPSKSFFGSTAPAGASKPLFSSTTPAGSPAKPSGTVGFSFGGGASKLGTDSSSLFNLAPNGPSPFGSRTTSPAPGSAAGDSTAANTDASDAEDATPPEPTADLTGLTEEEQREENVLFEVEKARALQLNGKTWENKGVGPLRILKNKSSGVVRVLHRLAPSGKVVINTRLLAKGQYKKNAKGTAQLTVVAQEGKPELWAVRMAKEDDALKFAEVCEEHKTAGSS